MIRIIVCSLAVRPVTRRLWFIQTILIAERTLGTRYCRTVLQTNCRRYLEHKAAVHYTLPNCGITSNSDEIIQMIGRLAFGWCFTTCGLLRIVCVRKCNESAEPVDSVKIGTRTNRSRRCRRAADRLQSTVGPMRAERVRA